LEGCKPSKNLIFRCAERRSRPAQRNDMYLGESLEAHVTITIRSLTEADLDAADIVLEAAYGPPLGPRHKDRLRRCLNLQSDGWLLALLDGTPAGMVGAMDYGPFAYIGLMAVHPSAQRRGIGLALMERLLAWLDTRGCPVALLDATDMGAPLYARLGFVEDEKTFMFRRDDCMLEPPPSKRVSQLRADDLPPLVDFDTPIFGTERPTVFASYFADDPARALVVRDESGRISGCLFAQAQMLGPWVARTQADAEALLATALTLSYAGAPSVIFPVSNAAAAPLLLRHGFSPRRTLSHMRRGGAIAPGQRSRLYGQASFVLG
jgi:GNAT superfamily N-acetyltransferase